jgi:hypothetical protein
VLLFVLSRVRGVALQMTGGDSPVQKVRDVQEDGNDPIEQATVLIEPELYQAIVMPLKLLYAVALVSLIDKVNQCEPSRYSIYLVGKVKCG